MLDKLKRYTPDASFVFVTGFIAFFYFVIALLYYCGERTLLSISCIPVIIHAIHFFWIELASSVALDDKNLRDIKLLSNISATNLVFLTLFTSWLVYVKSIGLSVGLFVLFAGLLITATVKVITFLSTKKVKDGCND